MRRVCALVLSIIGATAHAASPTSTPLQTDWQFRLIPADAQAISHPDAANWHAARVPGSVHTDLFANKLIADPYVGAPEGALQWIGLADWEYRTVFDVGAAESTRAHHDLVFEGLDTFADVYLNGEKLLVADNAFRRWRVAVNGKLHARANVLRVVFHSPITRLLPTVQAMPNKLAGNYPSPYGDEPKDAMTQNFARKPSYHYGWDWGPRYVTAGIWKPVQLESWDALRIADLHIQQTAIAADRAELAAQIELEADDNRDVSVEVSYRNAEAAAPQTIRQSAHLRRGANLVSVPLRIERPQLWYPNGYGAQALYTFNARIDEDGVTLARAERRTGLRRVELRHDADAAGRGFAFVINGVPVFAKGANIIPFDAFPARATHAQVARVLESARDAHMNMLRSWGGGYYESDEFFALADELGLMIWQDFMFGGGVEPAYDEAFRANVVAEARDNVRRLRDHPSLVLWCGNNEEETAWKNWGIGDALKKADPELAKKVWNGYLQLFGVELRDVVAQEGGGVPYWSSTPSNDLQGKANDSDNGDKHFWEVWAEVAKPVEAYLDETPRFMSEYGLQAWPSLRTIASFAQPSDMQIDAAVIRAHQKFLAGEGNARLLKYIRESYGEPRDFADFVYLSQIMQAEGIELAALHHRASRPRTMGSLYWQLNDVWPGASWSSIDWYGRWKALQFHARRFYADIAVAALRKDGRTTVSLISDKDAAKKGELRLRLLTFDGRLLREERISVALAARAVANVASYSDSDLLRGSDPKRTAAVFELRLDGTAVARRIVYFDAAKRLVLPSPGLQAALTRDGDAYRLVLHADKLAREVWIEFGDVDAELSDNALTLLPGESLTLRVTSRASLEVLQRALVLRSLYEPTPTPVKQ